MAIWEDVQKGVTDAANFTAKKASELAETAKQKYSIRSNESKIEKCFAEIGRMFYDSHVSGEDKSYEISTVIMQIEQLKKEIENSKNELSKKKQQTQNICTECGIELDGKANFCPNCGAKVEKAEECSEDCENSCECEDEKSESSDDEE